jgi:DNA-binding transcriptional ArsR family regulator
MPFDEPREVTDAKALRAMAHPVRLALLEALADAPALTATEAGEIVGESPANTSFHLRQLAKYGFVEEAEGATGRRRPWRIKQLGMRFSDVQDDPEAARAARALSRTMRDRYLARAEIALEESRTLPEEWRLATGLSQMRLYLSAQELADLQAEFVGIMLDRYGERRTERPPGTERVEILTIGYRVP